MENISESRRTFITTLILLLASGGLLLKYLTPRSKPGRQVLASCAAADVPPDGALVFAEQRLAVVRGREGVYALSLVCTHLGCTVSVTADELSCPCHGSRFDRAGRVLKGPADSPLRQFETVERDVTIEVYGT